MKRKNKRSTKKKISFREALIRATDNARIIEIWKRWRRSSLLQFEFRVRLGTPGESSASETRDAIFPFYGVSQHFSRRWQTSYTRPIVQRSSPLSDSHRLGTHRIIHRGNSSLAETALQFSQNHPGRSGYSIDSRSSRIRIHGTARRFDSFHADLRIVDGHYLKRVAHRVQSEFVRAGRPHSLLPWWFIAPLRASSQELAVPNGHTNTAGGHNAAEANANIARS